MTAAEGALEDVAEEDGISDQSEEEQPSNPIFKKKKPTKALPSTSANVTATATTITGRRGRKPASSSKPLTSTLVSSKSTLATVSKSKTLPSAASRQPPLNAPLLAGDDSDDLPHPSLIGFERRKTTTTTTKKKKDKVEYIELSD
jgi:hypothetical protein